MSIRRSGSSKASYALFAALLLAPIPAAARDRDAEDFTREMRDPRKQEAIGNAMAAMMSAMLSMKAEPLARAMEKMGDSRAARRIPRDATLGDLAGPEARRLPGEMRRKVPAMMGAAAEMAGMMEQMAPVLAQIGKEFEDKVDQARDQARGAPDQDEVDSADTRADDADAEATAPDDAGADYAAEEPAAQTD